MKEIFSDGKAIARHITGNDMKTGLNFYSNDEEFIQAGVWNYDKGKNLNAHIHNKVERSIDRTCEVLFVISGSIEASIYDENETLIDTLQVMKGEILVLLACGHGYRILENETKVLEVKNGPYPGADADRRRF